MLLAAGTAGTSSHAASVYVTLAVCGLFAWRGYYRALDAERSSGRSTYGWEPTTWSIVCFCLTIVGRVLLESAISRTPAAAAPVWAPPAPGAWSPPAWSAPAPAPAPAPASASASAPAVVAEPVAAAAPVVPEVPPPSVTLPPPVVADAAPPPVPSAPRSVDVLPRF